MDSETKDFIDSLKSQREEVSQSMRQLEHRAHKIRRASQRDVVLAAVLAVLPTVYLLGFNPWDFFPFMALASAVICAGLLFRLQGGYYRHREVVKEYEGFQTLGKALERSIRNR